MLTNMMELLALAAKRSASDVHLSPDQSPVMRIHGELIFVSELPILDVDTIKNFIYSVMTLEQQQQLKLELEVDFSIMLKNIARFRVNVFYQSRGIAAVFRLIPENVPTFSELNLPDVFKKIINFSQGLVLVTGPTGSGKSTTAAAMIDYLNQHYTHHIITIEDPIEFIHESKKSLVTQRQVIRDTRDFHRALRAALREDPDVVFVGEMRDMDTIRLALTAAETGHLVISTLHTSSAPRTINRIVDVFPAGEKNMIRNMLSESLQAVICQNLVKNLAGGRTPIFEIMLGTSAIRNLIREDKIAQMYSVMQMGSEVGMCTKEQYIQRLIAERVIAEI